MTLTAHAITGAAVASLIPSHPILGFCAAFGSHFILDALPHFEYPLRSHSLKPHLGAPLRYDLNLLHDLLLISIDGLLGLALALIIFLPFAGQAALIGAIGGMLPDAFQFVYMRFRRQPFIALQRFHRAVHTKNHLKHRPIFGILSQVTFAGFVVASTTLAYYHL